MNPTRLKRPRQVFAEKLWNLASWIYPYEPEWQDADDAQRQHEVGITFWGCTDAEAEKAFERLSDAVCGIDHHPLDCPGPHHVMSMRSTAMEKEDV